MARRYLMTWKGGKEARWRKMHRGQWHGVSCKELDAPPTKEGSWRAANEWWEAKKAELNAPDDRDIEARVMRIKTLASENPEVGDSDRARMVDEVVGEGAFQRLTDAAATIVRSAKRPNPDRTVAVHAESWRQLLHGSCQAGQLSESRYDSYRRDIMTFVRWIGGNSTIDSINETKIEEFFNHLSSKVHAGEFSPATAHLHLMTARQFIARLAEMKLIPIPGNLRSRRFRFNQGRATKIETFTVDEVRAMLATCEEWSERTRLYILLCLNLGAYQNDLAEMTMDEVDWKAGTITRARSKTRDRGGLVVTYQIWPLTFKLLKKHRAKEGDLVLTTEEGNPLVRRWLEGGKMRRYDLIHSAWSRMAKRMGLRKNRLGIKHLRKTAASILGTHPQFKFYTGYFLSHSPRGVTERSYAIPSEAEFFQALDWLRVQILGDDAS